MWRKLALCVGLPLVLLGVVAAATGGALADMPEAPGSISSNVQPPSPIQEVTFIQGVDGYTGCEDTNISAERPDQNLSDKPELVLGMRGQIGVLIRFDVSQVPADCLVEEAKLQLQVTNWDVPHVEPSINASYAVTRPWVVTEATWNHATATDRWGLAGCNDVTSDRSGEELSQQGLFDRDQWYTWDVTAAAQRWVEAPAANQGVYIRQLPTNIDVGGEYDLPSSEWPSPDKRPRLIVKYSCEPDIEVSKDLAAPSDGVAIIGESIAFTLRIQNTGTTPITQLTVSDSYDSDYLLFVDASEPPDEQAPGLLTWNTLDEYLPLARGEELVLTVNFQALASTEATVDTASAVGVDSYGQSTDPKTDDAVVTIVPPPSIAVTKEPEAATIWAYETVVFTLRVENTGQTAIDQLTVSDTYDSAFLSFVGSSEEPDQQAPGVITWSTLDAFLPLGPGESFALTVEFEGKAATPGTINTVTAQGVDEYGQPAGPESDDAVVTIEARLPGLAVSKEPHSATIGLCESVVFTVRVENTGQTAIGQLTVSDTYDGRFLSFVGSSESPDQQVPGLITWSTLDAFLPLGPGESFAFNVQFEGKAATPGTTDTVTAQGVDVYGQPAGPRTDDAVVTIEARPPGLAVAKEPSNSSATVSQRVGFTLHIRNTGTTAITQLSVTDRYDTEFLSFVGASPAPDQQAPGIITWNTLGAFLPLAPGAAFSLRVDFEAVQATEGTTNQVSAQGVDECGQAVGPALGYGVVQITPLYSLYIPKVVNCACRQETYCSAAGDPIFRIDVQDFEPYLCAPDEQGHIAASRCTLEHVGAAAPTGWNQWSFDDSFWLPGRPVDWLVWVEGVRDETGTVIWVPPAPPAGSEIIGLHLDGNAAAAEDEGIDETTHLYRRKFNLQPPEQGLVVTGAVLKMWSDNKTEWWWHSQDRPGVAPRSIAYDDQFEIQEVVLFPSPDGFDYIDSTGGEYLLAIQNSNDRQTRLGVPADPGLNPHGTAFCLVVNWGPCTCPPQIVRWLAD